MKDKEKPAQTDIAELSEAELSKAQGGALGGAGNDTLVRKNTIGTAPELQRYKK